MKCRANYTDAKGHDVLQHKHSFQRLVSKEVTDLKFKNSLFADIFEIFSALFVFSYLHKMKTKEKSYLHILYMHTPVIYRI